MNQKMNPELYEQIKKMYQSDCSMSDIVRKTRLRRETIQRVIKNGSPKLNLPPIQKEIEEQYLRQLNETKQIDINRRVELHDQISKYANVLSKLMIKDLAEYVEVSKNDKKNNKFDHKSFWKLQHVKSGIIKNLAGAINLMIPPQFHFLMAELEKVLRENEVEQSIRDQLFKAIENFGEINKK